ncbi:MAG TPA: hypothetical protein VHB30_11820, partial [Solirubrobacteraceae bacterium]|nr:hypothetical protein [Solirubrobacteraceae bacterium]
MSATALVDWSALGQVVLYALLAGVGLPAVYALAVLGAGRVSDARRAGRTAAATGYVLMSVAGAAVCLAAVAYGIWL